MNSIVMRASVRSVETVLYYFVLLFIILLV